MIDITIHDEWFIALAKSSLESPPPPSPLPRDSLMPTIVNQQLLALLTAAIVLSWVQSAHLIHSVSCKYRY